MRRELVFTFDNVSEALTFIEAVTNRIKSKELLIRYNVGSNVKVWVAIQGEPYEVELYAAEIKRIYNDIKLMRGKYGIRVYDVSLILSKAKLKAAMPIDLLVDILNIMGIEAEIEGSKIRVRDSLGLEDLVKIVEEVSELYHEMIDMEISAQAKRVIAIYSFIMKKPIKESIDDLLSHGLINRYGDSELLVLSTDYDHALLKLQELIEVEKKQK